MLPWFVLTCFFVIVFYCIFKDKETPIENENLKESLDILRIRYAKGELTTEEYLEKKRVIEGTEKPKDCCGGSKCCQKDGAEHE